jgi:hypothetical protein
VYSLRWQGMGSYGGVRSVSAWEKAAGDRLDEGRKITIVNRAFTPGTLVIGLVAILRQQIKLTPATDAGSSFSGALDPSTAPKAFALLASASTETSFRRHSILQRCQSHLKAVAGSVFKGYEPKRLQTP